MKQILYPKLILKNKKLRLSSEVINRIMDLIEESHLLRSLLINNARDKISTAVEVMQIANEFLDYISKKECTKKIVDPALVDKYADFIHMQNLSQAYYILSYVPRPKSTTERDAKLNNVFYYYLNMSGYYKRRIKKDIRYDSSIVSGIVKNLKAEFKEAVMHMKDETDDLDLLAKTFFETKMTTKRKAKV